MKMFYTILLIIFISLLLGGVWLESSPQNSTPKKYLTGHINRIIDGIWYIKLIHTSKVVEELQPDDDFIGVVQIKNGVFVYEGYQPETPSFDPHKPWPSFYDAIFLSFSQGSITCEPVIPLSSKAARIIGYCTLQAGGFAQKFTIDEEYHRYAWHFFQEGGQIITTEMFKMKEGSSK